MPPPGGNRTPLNVSYGWGSAAFAGAMDLTGAPGAREAFMPGEMFGPGYPLVPMQREAMRIWDYQVGRNQVYTPRAYEPVSFDQLIALAENHDITALAIETRKDQIEKLDWSIRPLPGFENNPDTDKRAQTATDFFQRPEADRDKPDNDFATWLRKLLHQMMVIDAPTLEVRRTRDGEVIGLDIVNGATISVLVDSTGRRPKPPLPAFMQVIKGLPWKLLTESELVYRPRNPRAGYLYGRGVVEQILNTINVALRRQIQQLSYFTDSNIPAGLLTGPADWTADQVYSFEAYFNSLLSGNTPERSKLAFGPAGIQYTAFKDPPFKDEQDEWLARVVCYAFSLPPTAFVRQNNKATAESAHDVALEEGLAPLMGWVKRFIDYLLQRILGYDDLEFAWSDEKPISPLDQFQIITGYVGASIMRINEGRDRLGLEHDPDGDRLIAFNGATAVLLSDIVEPPEPPPLPALPDPGAVPVAAGEPGNDGTPEQNTANEPPADGGNEGGEAEDGKAAVAKATAAEVDAAAEQAHIAPTPEQAATNSYPKGLVRLHGIDVVIETPKGSVRRGVGEDDLPWAVVMPAHYGFVSRSTGADDDEVDCFIGPQPESDIVFIVDQLDAGTGLFDEHKAMIGYPDMPTAVADYVASFSDGRGEQRMGAVHRVSVQGFRAWLRGDTTEPLGEVVGKADESRRVMLEAEVIGLLKRGRGERGTASLIPPNADPSPR